MGGGGGCPAENKFFFFGIRKVTLHQSPRQQSDIAHAVEHNKCEKLCASQMQCGGRQKHGAKGFPWPGQVRYTCMVRAQFPEPLKFLSTTTKMTPPSLE
jgi:hypothetical protein